MILVGILVATLEVFEGALELVYYYLAYYKVAHSERSLARLLKVSVPLKLVIIYR
jgi:hypothetical protein